MRTCIFGLVMLITLPTTCNKFPRLTYQQALDSFITIGDRMEELKKQLMCSKNSKRRKEIKHELKDLARQCKEAEQVLHSYLQEFLVPRMEKPHAPPKKTVKRKKSRFPLRHSVSLPSFPSTPLNHFRTARTLINSFWRTARFVCKII